MKGYTKLYQVIVKRDIGDGMTESMRYASESFHEALERLNKIAANDVSVIDIGIARVKRNRTRKSIR